MSGDSTTEGFCWAFSAALAIALTTVSGAVERTARLTLLSGAKAKYLSVDLVTLFLRLLVFGILELFNLDENEHSRLYTLSSFDCQCRMLGAHQERCGCGNETEDQISDDYLSRGIHEAPLSHR